MQDDSIIRLTDEDGLETPYQLLEEIDLDGCRYAVLACLDSDEDEESIEIFRIAGSDEYQPIEDEDTLQKVFDTFVSSDEDYEFCDAE